MLPLMHSLSYSLDPLSPPGDSPSNPNINPSGPATLSGTTNTGNTNTLGPESGPEFSMLGAGPDIFYSWTPSEVSEVKECDDDGLDCGGFESRTRYDASD